MSHSVRRHLHLDVREYDDSIRRFIPDYEEMMDVLAEAALSGSPGRVLDLGSGTGAVAGTLLARSEGVEVELLDADPEMLERARERLARFGGRARFRSGSFTEALPRADGVTASLALHHIPSLEEKEAVFRGIAAALPHGGVFVNGDVTLPGDPSMEKGMFETWAAHLVSRGIPEDRAWRHFEEWSEEDTYFPVEEELAALSRAGFDAGRVWGNGVLSVVVARRL